MAQEQSRAGKILQPKAEPSGDRRTAPALRPQTGQVTITADKRGTGSAKDTPAPGAKVVETNARAVGADESTVSAFIALVNRGISAWVAAGKFLTTWKKLEPRCFTLIIRDAPWISIATLEMFERIGNRSLFPRVLLLPPMLAERVSRLSYTEQEKMCAQPESTIRASVRSASHVRHKDRGRDCRKTRTQSEVEHSHIANLPCAGYWKVLVKDGKASVCKCDETARSVPVVLDENNCVVLQVLTKNRVQSDSDEISDRTPDKIHDGLTPQEKQWREFKNEQSS